jgi:hypothetical protein
MTHLAAFSKATWSAALALSLASACGGSSFSGGGDPKGGEGNAGSATTGGSGNVAGKGTGASHSAGTTSTAGTTSSGGTSSGGSEACNAPPESGSCEAYMERWYHDPATGLCRGFIYGGCGGNDNNYETFEQCQKACPGGSPNYDACAQPTDCVITGGGCCGICDSPDIKAHDLIAYNMKYAPNLISCGGPGGTAAGAAPPNDIACAPCPPLAADTGSLKYFVPNCVQGACVVEDIRTSPLSLCKTDQECTLRNGNSCCGSCGTSQTIAISSHSAFNQLVCGDTPPGCPDCVPGPTTGVAYCNPMTNHCQVAYPIDDNTGG